MSATPPPTADTPPHSEGSLTSEEVALIQDAKRSWTEVPAARVETGPDFVDPDLEVLETRGSRPGQRYVRVVRSSKQSFEKVAPGWLQVTPRARMSDSDFARFRRRLRSSVLGAPLATSQMVHERLTKVKALAVLSSDALSSVAYATEQIIGVLGTAAVAAAFGYTLPIAAAIVGLLAIVVLSYRQTIKAYPKGGGSYIVASDNLGSLWGLIAGCALRASYVLTVAVSVSNCIFRLSPVALFHGS